MPYMRVKLLDINCKKINLHTRWTYLYSNILTKIPLSIFLCHYKIRNTQQDHDISTNIILKMYLDLGF